MPVSLILSIVGLWKDGRKGYAIAGAAITGFSVLFFVGLPLVMAFFFALRS
jgi:hypothetical protein